MRRYIEKVKEGDTDSLRFVAFEITPDEIKKHMKEACRISAGHFEDYLEDVLRERGVSESEIRKIKEDIAMCRRDIHDVMLDHGIELDAYIPSAREISAQIVMSKALQGIKGAPHDAQASEEPGYGLPEFSLYYNPDARSWSGRWYWSESGDPEGICFRLVHDEKTCDKLMETIDDLEEKARKRGRQLLFAAYYKD